MLHFEGKIRLTFTAQALDRLCQNLISGYDVARFEPVAIRLFTGEETLLTVFAIDRLNQKQTGIPGKLPTRKFKVQLKSVSELFDLIPSCNFTSVKEGHVIQEIEVTNK